jgi:thiamine-phosphate diphosphorylase
MIGAARHRRWPARPLMLVTPGWCRPGEEARTEALLQQVEAALEGGVNVVQLREHALPAGELLRLARRLRGLCGHQALLLINDRADVALLSGADGVHLGVAGLPAGPVRQLLPPSMLVGCSVHSVDEARQAELEGADYILAGTVFASGSHPGAEPAGPELLRALATRLRVPVMAIGGVTAENAGECLAAGATGVATISALLPAQGVDAKTAALQVREAAARLSAALAAARLPSNLPLCPGPEGEEEPL